MPPLFSIWAVGCHSPVPPPKVRRKSWCKSEEGLRRLKGMIPLRIPRIFGAEAAPKIGVGGFFCLFS
jgi:hypothetical protein